MREWLRSLETDDRSTHTIRSYAGAVKRFLQWYESEEQKALEPVDLTPVALVGYRNELQHRQGKATASVNAEIAALRSWCEWLFDHGYLPANPAARLRSVRRQGQPAPKGLDDRQVNALLREASRGRHGQRDYALVQVLLQTGMRIGECAALEYEDVTFGERGGSVTIRGGKGNKARSVPLNASVRQALASYVAPMLSVEPTLAAVSAAWPRRRKGVGGSPLWRSQKGGTLSPQAIRRVIDGLVAIASARQLVPPDASAHTLRHTFAMFYQDLGPVPAVRM